MKKLPLFPILSLLTASLTFAQLPAETQEPAAPMALEAEEQEELDLTLEIWMMPNGPQPIENTLNLIEKFEEEKGIKVSLVLFEWADAWGRINDALRSKHAPHLIQLGSTWTPYFADQGLLTDLSEQNELINFNRFVDVLESSTRVPGKSGNYAVPWFVDARVLMANKAQLEMANIDPSTLNTYEGFKAGIKKIQATKVQNSDGDLVDGFGFPGKNDWNIAHDASPWVWNEGGEFIKNEQGVWQSGLMDPATVKGIRRYLSFALEGLVSKRSLSMNTNNIADRFNKGAQSLVIKTSETLLQLGIEDSLGGLKNSAIAKDEIITLPLPRGSKGSYSFIGGSHLAIPSIHSEDEGALELLLYLSQPQNISTYAKNSGFLPADKNALTKWSWSPMYTPLANAIKTGKTHPNLPEWGNLEASISEMMSQLLSLCENTNTYSEKEFYEVLVRYHHQNNRMLGINKSSIPDFLKFATYLDEEVYSQAKARGELKKSYTGWAIAGLIASILLMIALLAKKEQKDQEDDEKLDHDLEEAHHLHDND